MSRGRREKEQVARMKIQEFRSVLLVTHLQFSVGGIINKTHTHNQIKHYFILSLFRSLFFLFLLPFFPLLTSYRKGEKDKASCREMYLALVIVLGVSFVVCITYSTRKLGKEMKKENAHKSLPSIELSEYHWKDMHVSFFSFVCTYIHMLQVTRSMAHTTTHLLR